jgi:hypothetical protein
MINQVKNELDRKQGANLIGIIGRNVYTKQESRSAAESSNYVSAETIKDYQIRAEQERARATELALRRRMSIT